MTLPVSALLTAMFLASEAPVDSLYPEIHPVNPNTADEPELRQIPYLSDDEIALILLEREERPFLDFRDFMRRMGIERYRAPALRNCLYFSREKRELLIGAGIRARTEGRSKILIQGDFLVRGKRWKLLLNRGICDKGGLVELNTGFISISVGLFKTRFGLERSSLFSAGDILKTSTRGGKPGVKLKATIKALAAEAHVAPSKSRFFMTYRGKGRKLGLGFVGADTLFAYGASSRAGVLFSYNFHNRKIAIRPHFLWKSEDAGFSFDLGGGGNSWSARFKGRLSPRPGVVLTLYLKGEKKPEIPSSVRNQWSLNARIRKHFRANFYLRRYGGEITWRASAECRRELEEIVIFDGITYAGGREKSSALYFGIRRWSLYLTWLLVHSKSEMPRSGLPGVLRPPDNMSGNGIYLIPHVYLGGKILRFDLGLWIPLSGSIRGIQGKLNLRSTWKRG
ncbi:MAG: hypothetical protein J7K11_03455 [Candidatus Hydrothermae bacterium]|nr:hypothetical protein [Candidatus Hydrothermae bacterium]